MFGLETDVAIILIICLVCAVIFEFINGFHDTANAVATVIYTNSLKPMQAVVWSGIWNAIGVFLGGIGVGMGIVYLLPIDNMITPDQSQNIAMILAMLLSAILWNLGTWYFGIPCSSSHTLIGSIMGVGLAYSLLPGHTFGDGVQWSQAGKIGLSLLISPLLGFSLTIILMYILRSSLRDRKLFKEADKRKKPPFWVRLTLIATCTGVSYSHGSNDGQKGVGLVMLILFTLVPSYFAINPEGTRDQLQTSLKKVHAVVQSVDTLHIQPDDLGHVRRIEQEINNVQPMLAASTSNLITPDSRSFIREQILLISKNSKSLIESPTVKLSKNDKDQLQANVKELKDFVEYAPDWVIIMISLALGLGTMVGWKRIVKTIGEKIGKDHLSYAQGASAELVAAGTISLATFFKLPVSTTQVLSSGIAGSMVASRGVKNLQPKTIKTIFIAWLLTFPVTVVLSGLLFLLLRLVL